MQWMLLIQNTMNVLQQSSVKPHNASKSYWSFLKTFVNGIKIPFISLLLINNELITDFKVACRVKINTTWTAKNTVSFNYFSKKFKTNALQGHKSYIKIFELEINNLRIQILAAKMTWFYLKILHFASSKSL